MVLASSWSKDLISGLLIQLVPLTSKIKSGTASKASFLVRIGSQSLRLVSGSWVVYGSEKISSVVGLEETDFLTAGFKSSAIFIQFNRARTQQSWRHWKFSSRLMSAKRGGGLGVDWLKILSRNLCCVWSISRKWKDTVAYNLLCSSLNIMHSQCPPEMCPTSGAYSSL